MPFNVSYSNASDFPDSLPLFPLPSVLLLPRGQMPLNVFEPRYVTMIDDVLKGARLIGIIQPLSGQSRKIKTPKLYDVGCIGRITQFAESGDGRYMLTLTGVIRFKLSAELSAISPYRQVQFDVADFLDDLEPRAGEDAVNRDMLLSTLRKFSEANDVSIDWDGVKEAPNEALVNALSMMAPYGVKEKQALLEAQDLNARAEMLIAITEFELAKQSDGETTVQ